MELVNLVLEKAVGHLLYWNIEFGETNGCFRICKRVRNNAFILVGSGFSKVVRLDLVQGLVDMSADGPDH